MESTVSGTVVLRDLLPLNRQTVISGEWIRRIAS